MIPLIDQFAVVILGRPREKPTLPIALSTPHNSKPIPHRNAKYLMLYLNL